MPIIEVKVPDIGDFTDVPVVEILVSPGDTVQSEDPLISLESDKATMDIPSLIAGKVTSCAVSVGDKIKEGDVICTVSVESANRKAAHKETEQAVPAEENITADKIVTETVEIAPSSAKTNIATSEIVTVPDIGDFENVEVIEILVKPGDQIKQNDPIVTIESDKSRQWELPTINSFIF